MAKVISDKTLRSTTTLRYQFLTGSAHDPVFSSDGAAAFDLKALLLEPVTLDTGWDGYTFSTGLRFDIPANHVLLVFSRSGHGFNYNVRLSNCVGVIDEDYTGELKVRLTCDGETEGPLIVNDGDRIAQCILMPKPAIKLERVKSIDKVTTRGNNGFGSTGK